MRICFASLSYIYLFYGFIILLVGWWVVIRMRKAAGKWRLRFYALPRPWLKYLHQDVPFYEKLPLELRAEYQDKVVQFVDAKLFRPGGSIEEVTYSHQVPIAGNACLLLLNIGNDNNYPRVLTVYVYDHKDTVPEPRSSTIILLWDEANRRAIDPRDRDKSTLIPIASQLGWETAGKSALPDVLLIAPWARVRTAEFVEANPGLLEKAAQGEAIDVFAVATEMFLAVPALLQRQHPALYEAMRLFYRVDPARWKTK
ncbi:MAG TPA: zinc-dependent peptidase [Verrucomicrobiales bacterium]|nr:zinc-dependent peptidase [Verrucomicrobiales bacterium]